MIIITMKSVSELRIRRETLGSVRIISIEL
jgi:hypothetical protein